MKKGFAILSLMFLVVLSQLLSAQDIDSLETVAANAPNVTKRMNAVSQLSFRIIETDSQRSDELFREAMSFYINKKQYETAFEIIRNRVAKCGELGRADLIINAIDGQEMFLSQLNDNPEVIKIYIAASNAMIDAQNYELAAIYLMKSQAIAEAIGDTATLIHNAINIGYCYSIINNDERSIVYYKEAERLTILQGDTRGLIDIYLNLGTAYEYRHSLDTALEYHFKSLKYSFQTADSSLLWLSYYNIAYVYYDYKKYDEALDYCRQAIKAAKVTYSPWPIDYPMMYSLVAKVFASIGQNDSVIAYHQLTLESHRESGNANGEATALSMIGDTYREMKNYRLAMKSYNQALDICLKNNILSLQKDIYEGMSKLYSANRNYELAYSTLEKASLITDSLLNSEREQARSSLTKQLQTKEQVMLIEHEMSEERQREQFQTERQNARHRMLIGVLSTLALIAVVMILMQMRVRRINTLLKKANGEINLQKSQLEKVSEEVRRRNKFLDLLINTIPMPLIYIKGDKSAVLGCNEAFEQFCGVKRATIIGYDIDNLSRRIGIECNLDDARISRKIRQMQFPDGRVRDVICYVSELSDEGGYGDLFSVVMVDVTELENIRRELCQSQQKLEEALSVKTKFFSIFAHDLKNPFNGILGMTNLLVDYYENYSADDIKKYLNVINDSATRVYGLLTNLLDWAKSQTGMIEVNPTNFYISEPINEALSVNKYTIDQKNIKMVLQIDYEYSVMADKNMILTVFRNLIGNALKFTPMGGRITISARLNDDNKIEVSISDNGVGIPPENLPRLFNVDQPLTTPGLENEKGSGLGLIICQEFVRRNGGQIAVSSEVGKGSTFTFTLNRA